MPTYAPRPRILWCADLMSACMIRALFSCHSYFERYLFCDQIKIPSFSHNSRQALFTHQKVLKKYLYLFFFLFLYENICCRYSLEAPHWGTSNEYSQQIFHGETRKNIYMIPSYMELCKYWLIHWQLLLYRRYLHEGRFSYGKALKSIHWRVSVLVCKDAL